MSTIYTLIRVVIYSQVIMAFKIENLTTCQDYAFNLTLGFSVLAWALITENYYFNQAIQDNL